MAKSAGNTSTRRFFEAYVKGKAPPPPTVNDDAVRRFNERFGQPIRDDELTSVGSGGNSRRSGRPSVTTGPINVTVNVQTNADPNAIGNATGGAVRDRLRGLLGTRRSPSERRTRQCRSQEDLDAQKVYRTTAFPDGRLALTSTRQSDSRCRTRWR
jgi:hypothetical protein